jgi:hypothetical protein
MVLGRNRGTLVPLNSGTAGCGKLELLERISPSPNLRGSLRFTPIRLSAIFEKKKEFIDWAVKDKSSARRVEFRKALAEVSS